MRRRLVRLANRIALMGAVVLVSVLLLGDAALWRTLLPMWLALLFTLHLAMQHLATRLEARAPHRVSHPLLQLLVRAEPNGLTAAPPANIACPADTDQR
jgi:hypothetical protein